MNIKPRRSASGMVSILKFKFFKYYVLVILLILLINVIVLFRTNFNPELVAKGEKLHRTHIVSDVYEERDSNKINKKYKNSAWKAWNKYRNVSDEIHREILYELDVLDKYFLAETRSEFIQNKYKNLVSHMKMPDRKLKDEGSWSYKANELNEWLIHQTYFQDQPSRNPIKYYLNLIGKVSHLLCQSTLIKTDLLNKGTQLKFLVTLAESEVNSTSTKPLGMKEKKLNFDKEIWTLTVQKPNLTLRNKVRSSSNKIRAVFKPKWYDTTETFPNVVDGKDRHYGELVAFLLSVLLEIYTAPLTLLKTLTIVDMVSTASPNLNLTYFENEKKESCFTGKCLYCTPENALCSSSTIQGALILYIENGVYRKVRHPYQRSYVKNKSKPWESDPNFCFNHIAKLYDNQFILDIVDIAVFDFLIQNGDRHHLEKVSVDHDLLNDVYNEDILTGDDLEQSKIKKLDKFVLFDNGKSFGNPVRDNLDILAPLYQCCILRSSTYNRLVQLRGGLMIQVLKSLSRQSVCDGEKDKEVMTDAQWNGMARRLNLVYATVNYCMRKHHGKTILVK